MIEWIRSHEVLLWWLAATSVVTFFGTLVALPFLVSRIPPDYFARRGRRAPRSEPRRHPVLRGMAVIGKNLAGVLFIIAGIAMLFLPGQGVITILIGVLLMDFPGKFTLERWLIRRPAVLRSINWLREKAHHPPLELPDSRPARAGGDAMDEETS